MNRFVLTAAAVIAGGAILLAQAGTRTTGQTTPPPATTQKPATPPAQAPAAPAPAAPVPFPAGATIAYVRLQGVIAGSKYGQCNSQVLNDLRTRDQAALAPKQKELQDLQAKIQAQQGTVSDSAMTQMQRDLQRVQLEGQALAQQQQTDEDNKNQDMLNDFQAKVMPLIEAIRKEKNLQFIMSTDTNAILAVNLGLDLTGEVIKRLDAAYPACKKDAGQ